MFGKLILHSLYGVEFVDAFKVTLLLSLGSISMVYYKMIGVVLLSEGKRWIYFIVLLMSVTANTIGNLKLIPLYGMYGAALSSIISYSICGISLLIYFCWDNKMPLKEMVMIKKSEIYKLFRKR